MIPKRRTALLTACSFAKQFITAADNELRAAGTELEPAMRQDREHAQEQAIAALRALEPTCTCTHALSEHEATTSLCVRPDCPCLMFEEVR